MDIVRRSSWFKTTKAAYTPCKTASHGSSFRNSTVAKVYIDIAIILSGLQTIDMCCFNRFIDCR
jgi:hypothetical protein